MFLLGSLFSGLLLPSIITSVKAADESNIVIPCVADAYVDQSALDTNFNVSRLIVRSAAGQNARSFLRFNVTTIPPAAIVSAELKVFVTKPPSVPRKYRVLLVCDRDWKEDEITWNTWPGAHFEGPYSSAIVNMTQGWVSFDVTAHVIYVVKGWRAPWGFMILDEREDSWPQPVSTEFASREDADDALRPVLNVTVGYKPDFQIVGTLGLPTICPGGSVDFGVHVWSVNTFEGDIDLSVAGLHPSMLAEIRPQSFHLGSGQDCGIGITIRTGPYFVTPAGVYSITITAKSGAIEHNATVQLEVRDVLIHRELPSRAANDTYFIVKLTYEAGIVPATGLVINERLPTYVNFLSCEVPNVLITSFNKTTYPDGTQMLKWVLANSTALSKFELKYTVHFVVPAGEGVPDILWFNQGSYGAVSSAGQHYWDGILGDQGMEVTRGLPGPWDDDGKVNDDELLQALNLWNKGELTTSELLAYIDLWSKTWWL